VIAKQRIERIWISIPTLLFDRKRFRILFPVVSAFVLVTSLLMLGGWSEQVSAAPATTHATAATSHPGIDCASDDFRCVDLEYLKEGVYREA
jgi:hypothetical protein